MAYSTPLDDLTPAAGNARPVDMAGVLLQPFAAGSYASGTSSGGPLFELPTSY